MIKCFHDDPIVGRSSASIFHSSMRGLKSSTIRNTVIHEVSSLQRKDESHAGQGHWISFGSNKERLSPLPADVLSTKLMKDVVDRLYACSIQLMHIRSCHWRSYPYLLPYDHVSANVFQSLALYDASAKYLTLMTLSKILLHALH